MNRLRFVVTIILISLQFGAASAATASVACQNAVAGKHWGVQIPALAVSAKEMPDIPGLLTLENPEIGIGGKWEGDYTLEDVARAHATYIHEHPQLFANHLKLIGMSMGGMILAIMASEYRELLPEKTTFHFYVTSPNLPIMPAVPLDVFQSWTNTNVKDREKFGEVLGNLFSNDYLKSQGEQFDDYVSFRMQNGNHQQGRAFWRQLMAVQRFQGSKYFPRIRPEEAFFTGGLEDRLFGPSHSALLRQLLPGAYHREIPGLGHMVNFERPELFDLR